MSRLTCERFKSKESVSQMLLGYGGEIFSSGTNGNLVYTNVQMINGVIQRNTTTGPYTDTTATATDIISALPDAAVGTGFYTSISNSESSTTELNISPGAGVSFTTPVATINTVIQPGEFRLYRVGIVSINPDILTMVLIGYNQVSGGGGTPGGSNTQIQFNDSGSFGGSANLTWDNLTQSLAMDSSITQTSTLTPTVEGTLNDLSLANTTGLSVQGDYAIVTCSTVINIVNISNPSSPTLIDSITPVGGYSDGRGCKAIGKYFCTTSELGNDFYIFDGSDPSNISPSGEDSIVNGTSLNQAYYFDIAGSFAFVPARGGSRLTSIDISNPSSLTIVSSLNDANLLDITDVKIYGKYAYTIGDTKFNVIDITSPSSMVIIDTITDVTNLIEPSGIKVRGNYVYICTIGGRFIVIDIEDKTSTSIVGNLSNVILNDSADVDISGNYAYVVTDTSNFVMVDISDPTSPSIVTSFAMGIGVSLRINIQGKYAYVIGNGEFRIFNLNGTELTSVDIGNLQVRGGCYMGQNVGIAGTLNVASGAEVNNSLSVMSCFTVHGPTRFNNGIELMRPKEGLNGIRLKEKNIIDISVNGIGELNEYSGSIYSKESVTLINGQSVYYTLRNSLVRESSIVLISIGDLKMKEKTPINYCVSNVSNGSFQIQFTNMSGMNNFLLKFNYIVIS